MKDQSNTFDIINCPLEGLNLIEASAGTGKTYNITGLYLRLLIENFKKLNADISKILVVTFTNSATAELQDRILNKLYEAQNAFNNPEEYKKSKNPDDLILSFIESDLEEKKNIIRFAIQNFDEASIFTIHGFCQQSLIDNAFESSSTFNTTFISDQSVIQDEVINDFLRRFLYKNDSFLISLIFGSHSFYKIKEMLKSIATELENKPLIKIKQSHKKLCFKKDISNPTKNICKSILNFDSKKLKDFLASNCTAFNQQSYKMNQVEKKYSVISAAGNNIDYIFKNFSSFKESIIYFSRIKLLEKLKKESPFPEHEFFDFCENLLPALEKLEESIYQYQINFKIEFIDYYKSEMDNRKKSRQVRYFSDLLSGMYEAISGPNSKKFIRSIQQKYYAAMIDEFQDTNTIQYCIFNKIFNAKNTANVLYFIGDPKQSIYMFRGADIFAYLECKKDTNNRYTLINNYRSHKNIVNSINTIFQRQNPFIIEDIDFVKNSNVKNNINLIIDGKEDTGTDIIYFNSEKGFNANSLEENAAEYTAVKISSILNGSDDGKSYIIDDENNKVIVEPKNIAVLTAANYQSELVKQKLREYNINSVIKSTKNIYESEEAVEILYILSAIANPGHREYFFSALSSCGFCLSLNDIEKIHKDENLFIKYIDDFQNYNKMWQEKGFIIMFKSFMHDYKIKSNLHSYPDGLRKITNYLHIAELIHIQEKTSGQKLSSLLNWYNFQLCEDNGQSEQTLRLDSDDDAVQITTVHKSKGLEYDIVFIPFLWKSRKTGSNETLFFFHENGKAIMSFDSNDKDNDNLIKENLSEQLRLLYVALTRAKFKNYYIFGMLGSRANAFQVPYYLAMDNQANDFKNFISLKTENDLIRESFHKIAKNSNSSIKIIEDPVFAGEEYKSSKTQFTPYIEKLNNSIHDDFRITSYSFLVSNNNQMHDYKKIEVSDEKAEQLNLNDFPKGAKAGSCIHSIFENIDFNNPDTYENAVIEAMVYFGFEDDELDYKTQLQNMITNVLNSSLKSDSEAIVLKDLAANEYLAEMEFYFPIKTIDQQKINDLIKTSYPEFADQYLEFDKLSGFLKGYIDLIIKHNDRYYILDWKSNFLGDTLDSYKKNKLIEAMNDHKYYFQYLIYSCALSNYLKNKIPNYEYNKHFGGVFYLFVRGISPENNQNGIFYDRPEENIINNLNKLLME